MLQATEPWISTGGIEKGSPSLPSISHELENTESGIICLVPENKDSNWIHFEAGALSKTAGSNAWTFLLGLNPSDIKPPLGQFQHTEFTQEDIFKLIQTINQKLKTAGSNYLEDDVLKKQYEILWPYLQKDLDAVLNSSAPQPNPQRSEREILEEILDLARSQQSARNELIHSVEEIRSIPFTMSVGSSAQYKKVSEELIHRIYEAQLSQFKIGDAIQHPKYGTSKYLGPASEYLEEDSKFHNNTLLIIQNTDGVNIVPIKDVKFFKKLDNEE